MKPILFNTDMVRAILDERKTVTRRVVKHNPCECESKRVNGICKLCDDKGGFFLPDEYVKERSPYRPGDILYVRETWCWCYCWDCGADTEEGCCDETAEKSYNPQKAEWGCYGYRASFEENEIPFDGWRPSIHMPREAARIFLRVTDVRVERLQDITEEHAEREGCSAGRIEITGGPWGIEDDPEQWTAREHFADVWGSTIKPADRALYGWDANPWVWVISFERISREEAENGLQRAD